MKFLSREIGVLHRDNTRSNIVHWKV